MLRGMSLTAPGILRDEPLRARPLSVILPCRLITTEYAPMQQRPKMSIPIRLLVKLPTVRATMSPAPAMPRNTVENRPRIPKNAEGRSRLRHTLYFMTFLGKEDETYELQEREGDDKTAAVLEEGVRGRRLTLGVLDERRDEHDDAHETQDD